MPSLHSSQTLGVPGPSSMSTTYTPPTTTAKRRRSDSATDPDTGVGPIRNTRKDKDSPVPNKKKKAARACIHCQRAHLTCDDSRPCHRCTKRGMADSCVEGHRKRAKYLLGDDELELLKKRKASTATIDPSPPVQAPPPSVPSVVDTFSPTNPLFNPAFDAPSFPFGSEAANLEYSILSAILGKTPPEANPPLDPHSSATPPPPAHPFTAAPSEYATSWSGVPNDSLLTSEPSPFLTSPFTGVRTAQTMYESAQLALPNADRPHTGSSSSASTDLLSQTFSTLDPASSATSSSVHTPQESAILSPSKSLLSLTPRWPVTESATLDHLGPKTAEEVYGSITKPYDYTEGYHFLMKVLPLRFEKNDILRVVRALAIFRPSLIALQMPLTEEDEIFVEKCVQRSLIELNKLIAYSGTPTVVWRRTGEICLVGPEFSMLTGWSKEELLGSKKYIWEIFENQSVVEYWENFATHAFENAAQSVYSHCVLLKPNGTPVPATFCFHIRRDIFDLPSLVIGQWLPLL